MQELITSNDLKALSMIILLIAYLIWTKCKKVYIYKQGNRKNLGKKTVMLVSYQLYFNIILNYFILFARRKRYALTKLKLFAIRFHPLYPVGISTVINPYSTLVSTVQLVQVL